MASGVFNVARGIGRYYAGLPAANDALLVILLKSAGLEADDVLNNYDDLAALLASTNDEADFTNYSRKVVNTSVTITPDDTNNRVDVDMPDQTWASAGGVANNTIGKLIICYRPDTGSADSAVVPMTYHDFATTTDGLDLTAQINTAGFYRAA